MYSTRGAHAATDAHRRRATPLAPLVGTPGVPKTAVGYQHIEWTHLSLSWPPMNKNERAWTVAITEEDVFNSDFGIRGIPFVAILDTDGKVYKVGMHPSNEEEIRKTIDELLAKNSKSANAG